MIKSILVPTNEKDFGVYKSNLSERLGFVRKIKPRFQKPNLIDCSPSFQLPEDDCKPFNIILVDTEAEIVEGDWIYISRGYKDLLKGDIFPYDNVNYIYLEYSHKIISSTNKSHTYKCACCDGTGIIEEEPCRTCTGGDLGVIPQLSNNSIQLLINYYNEHKCMPESVEVETEEVKRNGYAPNTEGAYHKIIKLNKQGEVDIIIPEVDTKSHLTWIFDRLVHVHRENPNCDYMLKLKEIAKEKVYTEDEVDTLLFNLAEHYGMTSGKSDMEDFNDWVEENKKH